MRDKIISSHKSGWILIGSWWYNVETGRVIAPISGGGSNSYAQQAYRFVSDDGAANSGTLEGAGNNSPVSQQTGTDNRKRIRVVVEETTGNKTETQYFEIWASYDGGAYFHVTTSSSIVRSIGSFNSGWTCTDEDATTARLGYAGSFTTGRWDDDGAVETGVQMNGQYTECEFCYYLIDADVADAKVILIELRKSGGGALNAYNQRPQITVDKGAAPINVNLGYGAVSATGQQLDVVPGAVSVGLGVGSASVTGLQADISAPPPTTSVDLGLGSLAVTGLQSDVIPGAVGTDLNSGAVSITGQQLSVDAGVPWPYSDDFEAYTASAVLGGQGVWVAVNSNIYVVDNSGDNVVKGNAANNESCVRADVAPDSADYFAQLKLDAVTGGGFIGPAVRCQSGAATYYALYADTADIYLGRVVAGSWSTLDSVTGGTISGGDVLKLAVVGTGATVSLTCYRNGSLITDIGTNGTYNDSSGDRITTAGYAGVAGWNNLNTYGDDFEADNLGIAPTNINLGYGAVSVDGQQSSIIPGAIGIGLGYGGISSIGQQLDVVPGSMAIELGYGGISASGLQAAVVVGAVAVELGYGGVSINGLQLSVGAITEILLGQGSLSISGRQLVVNRETRIGLGLGGLSISGLQALLVPGAVGVGLNYGGLSIDGQPITIGAITEVFLGYGQLSASGLQLDVVPGGIGVGLGYGSLTISGQTLTIVPGAFSLDLGYGSIVASGKSLSVVPGAVGVELGVASQTISGLRLSVGAVLLIDLGYASLGMGGLQLDVIPGARSLDLGLGSLLASGRQLVVTPGGIALPMGMGSLSATGQQLVVYSHATINLGLGGIAIAGLQSNVTVGSVITLLGLALVVLNGRQLSVDAPALVSPGYVDIGDYALYNVVLNNEVLTIVTLRDNAANNVRLRND